MRTIGRQGEKLAVVSLFLFMLFIGYFWPFQVSLDDVRAHLPAFIDREVQSVLDRLPPDKSEKLRLPLPEVKYQCDFYYDRVVSTGEYNATFWISNNTDKDDKFVADIFAGELIMGMTTRVSTEGGDWANAPDPISMMTHTNDIYKTNDAAHAYELAKLEKADYVFVPYRGLYTGWWLPKEEVNYAKFNDSRYFEPVFVDDNVTVYRIK
ncbi:hypothetical protein Mtc_1385 [Methanocella conradii HZ254]|uniref:Uncharacterized protein n=1 Tax=Methanocella conradii (strain DSM 24694 / JCM 17849 / CGMCC 1.5162 / HZ254) TaxID=1041930 RepID=H8IAP2_METCZ|nr:hypothetical protein [Methanocella conradii]AFD00139.1 hypothetical protein Mtc_1385 [Methanocella conradii HZ254]